MTPRWPLFVLFAVAGVPLAGPALLEAFTDVPVSTHNLMEGVGLGLNLLVFAAAALDAALSPKLSRVLIEREAASAMSVGARNAVRIWLTNRNARPIQVECLDDVPQPSTTDELPFTINLAPHKARYHVYRFVPLHRGAGAFENVTLRSISRLRLWTLYEQRPLHKPVRVYPDIQAVRGIELLARKNRIAEAGVKLSRLRGRGNEFDRLREYRREDEMRHVDWKATARHQSLIAREYVVERNQNILLVLDCGRSMRNEAEGISHLDRALNAAIMLAYVALRQGDNVGLLAFSNRTERWVRPLRGAAAVQTIIRSVYDLAPRFDASDYELMTEELRLRFRKRSLVVLLTFALDELHLAAISQALFNLRSTHLMLAAFLRNVPLAERVQSLPRSDVDAFQIAAAAELLHTQALRIAELEHAGLMVLDTLPAQLSANLVSRYLDIKARNLL